MIIVIKTLFARILRLLSSIQLDCFVVITLRNFNKILETERVNLYFLAYLCDVLHNFCLVCQ